LQLENLRGVVDVAENFLALVGGKPQIFFPRFLVEQNPPITTTARAA